MKKYRRLGLLSIALLLLLSIALTGCSSSSTTSGKSANGVTTITVWHGMTQLAQKAIENVTKAFEKKYPNIKVKLVQTSGGTGANKKLLAAIAGGNPPDVVYFDRFKVSQYAAQGALTDLTSMAKKSGVSKNNFYPFAWEEASYKGKLYAIPTTTDSRLLFYNKDAFKKAGLNPNNPPKTIAQLNKDAAKLTIKNGSHFKQIGFIPWDNQGELYTWGWAFGGSFYNKKTGKFTANNPKIVKALKWETSYAKKYGIGNLTSFSKAQGSGAQAPFISGHLAMMVSGNFEIPAIKKFNPKLNYGVTPIPTPTGSNFQTWSGGWSVVMPKGAKHQKAAWKYMKFFGSPKAQEIFTKTDGDLTAIPSVNKKVYANNPLMDKFVKAEKNAHHRPVIPVGQLAWNQLLNAVDYANHNKGTPKQILDQVTKKVNKALGK